MTNAYADYPVAEGAALTAYEATEMFEGWEECNWSLWTKQVPGYGLMTSACTPDGHQYVVRHCPAGVTSIGQVVAEHRKYVGMVPAPQLKILVTVPDKPGDHAGVIDLLVQIEDLVDRWAGAAVSRVNVVD